jgi:hypothetical protein
MANAFGSLSDSGKTAVFLVLRGGKVTGFVASMDLRCGNGRGREAGNLPRTALAAF